MKFCKIVIRFINLIIIYIGLTSQELPSIFTNKQIKKILDKYNLISTKVEPLSIPDSCYLNLGLNGKMYIYSDTLNNIKYIYLGRVNTCRVGGCSINNTQSNNYENFDYIIFFNKSKTIEYIKIIEYNATHGHEITAPSWLKQFKYYNGEDTLEVGKNIDAISGATISTNSITQNIQQVMKLLLQYSRRKVE